MGLCTRAANAGGPSLSLFSSQRDNGHVHGAVRQALPQGEKRLPRVGWSWEKPLRNRFSGEMIDKGKAKNEDECVKFQSARRQHSAFGKLQQVHDN